MRAWFRRHGLLFSIIVVASWLSSVAFVFLFAVMAVGFDGPGFLIDVPSCLNFPLPTLGIAIIAVVSVFTLHGWRTGLLSIVVFVGAFLLGFATAGHSRYGLWFQHYQNELQKICHGDSPKFDPWERSEACRILEQWK